MESEIATRWLASTPVWHGGGVRENGSGGFGKIGTGSCSALHASIKNRGANDNAFSTLLNSVRRTSLYWLLCFPPTLTRCYWAGT